MPDPTLTAALKEAYAAAPADIVILHTLELNHASFSQPLRVVRDYATVSVKLEATAPHDPNGWATFAPYPFDFKLPPAGNQGVPELELTIDNVGADLIAAFDGAANSTTPVTMIYRPYLTSDLSLPTMNPPLQMVLRSISADMFRITAKAGFGDLGNRRFPSLLYTTQVYPGLAP